MAALTPGAENPASSSIIPAQTPRQAEDQIPSSARAFANADLPAAGVPESIPPDRSLNLLPLSPQNGLEGAFMEYL